MAAVRIVDYFSLKDAFYNERSETLFCSPTWIRVLYKTYGFKCYAAIDDKKDICIPLVLVDNPMGKKLTSLPFSDYTDINTDTPEKYRDIIAKVEVEYPDVPLILKTIGSAGNPGNADPTDDTDHSWGFHEALWGESIRTAYYHRVATSTGTKIRQAQSNSFKRNVAKAKNTGLTVGIKKDIIALLDFYRLYTDLRMNKFNSIPQPFAFFETIFDEFIDKGKGFLVEAVYEKKTVASVVVLEHKQILYYKFGASDEEHLDLRPNNLIFDELIRYAQKKGFQEVDLGLSGTGDSYKGLVRFKESMGGVASPITYFNKGDLDPKNKNEALGQWLTSLTDEIVLARPDLETVSRFSGLIYPLFA